MRYLLKCATPRLQEISCCETPYTWLYPDCVEACLNEAIAPAIREAFDTIDNSGYFGFTTPCDNSLRLIEDLRLVADLALQAFNLRVSDIARTGIDLGQAHYWGLFQMNCWVTYFSTVHKYDIRTLLIKAGFYQADTVVQNLPLPYLVPCGDPPPSGSPNCDPVIMADIVAAVDTDDLAAIIAGPPLVGDTYLVATDTIGTSFVPGTLIRWNGFFEVVPFNLGNVFRDQGGVLWTMLGLNSPGQLYPPVTMVLNAPNIYALQSTYPQIAWYSGRMVTVRAIVDGLPVIVYNGPENDIGYPVLVNLPADVESVEATYSALGCTWPAPPVQVVPPLNGCGTLVATTNPVLDCSNNSWSIDVNIVSITGFPVGLLVQLINGIEQPGILMTGIDAILVGPYQHGDTVQLTITNLADAECNLFLGSFTTPLVYSATETADRAVDVAFEPSALPGVTYLIVSNLTGAVNGWTGREGQTVTDAVFTTPADGTVLQMNSPSGASGLWQVGGGTAIQAYPPIMLVQTMTLGGIWQLISTNPPSTVGRYRTVYVEVQNENAEWSSLWIGVENDLAIGVDVPWPGFMPYGVRATYFDQCPKAVSTRFEPEDFTVELDCVTNLLLEYQYGNFNQSWLFNTLPGQTITITFISGTIQSSDDIIRIYDGVDNSGILLAVSTVDSLSGLTATTAGTQLYMEVDTDSSDSVMDGTQTEWLFQVGCSQPNTSPSVSVVVTDDCPNDEFSIDVEILFAGDNPSTQVVVRYSVNGGAPTNTVPLNEFDIAVLGPFPLGSIVFIEALHETNPLSNFIAGFFTDNDSCPDPVDPCLPTGGFKLDGVIDLSDLPAYDDPAYSEAVFLIISDNDGLGTFPPFTMVTNYNGGGPVIPWVPFLLPPGTVIQNQLLPEFYVVTSSGSTAVSYYAPASLWIQAGAGVGEYYLRGYQPPPPETFFQDRPVRLQFLVGGVWQTAWTGVESDVVDWVLVTFTNPWTQARWSYNYIACPVHAAAIIYTSEFETNPICLPPKQYDVRFAIDLAELPYPGSNPPATRYFIVSDTGSVGTLPVGSIVVWSNLLTDYQIAYTPIAPETILVNSTTFWIMQPGPELLFPPIVLTPIAGNTYEAHIPEIQLNNVLTDRPVAIFTGQQYVWTGTEQQLVTPIIVVIPTLLVSFYTVYNFASCPVYIRS